MGIHTNREVTPNSALFKPGDFVQIRAYGGFWIVEEYVPPDGDGDAPRWRCRSGETSEGSVNYPCWGLGKKERDLFIYKSAYEFELKPIEPRIAENIVTAVDIDIDGAVPGIWATLSCRTFPKWATSPLDADAFLEELYDMGAIITDDMHAQILEACNGFALAFAA